MFGEVGKHVAECQEERCAEHGANDRIGRAQDHHGQELARQLPAQGRRAHELGVVRHQRAGETGNPTGDDEDHELVRIGREADGGDPPLVVADAADHHAELGAHDAACEKHDQDQQRQHDVVEGGVIGERDEAETVALGQGEAVVAAPIAQALGEVIDHLREGECHHDELEAAGTQRQRPDRKRDQHGDQYRERPDDERVGQAEDGEHAGGIGADPEQRRLPERDQPGIAEQQVYAERGHAVDRDLGGEARVVDAENGRQHDRGREQQQQKQGAAGREGHVSPDARQRGRCG